MKTRLSAHSLWKLVLIHMKISFVCMWMKTNFHNEDFALSLAFIMRFTVTRKWPGAWNGLLWYLSKLHIHVLTRSLSAGVPWTRDQIHQPSVFSSQKFWRNILEHIVQLMGVFVYIIQLYKHLQLTKMTKTSQWRKGSQRITLLLHKAISELLRTSFWKRGQVQSFQFVTLPLDSLS